MADSPKENREKHQPQENTAQPPSPPLAAKEGDGGGIHNPEAQQQTSSEEQKPPKWARIKRGLHFFTKSEWVMVFLTFVIATTGVVGIILIIQSGGDTQKMITAAQQPARAAQHNAAAAQQFADTAVLIDGGIGDAVKKLDAQAKGVIKLSGNANSMTQMQQDQALRASGDPVVKYDGIQLCRNSHTIFADILVKNSGTKAVTRIAARLSYHKPTPQQQNQFLSEEFLVTTPPNNDGGGSVRRFLPDSEYASPISTGTKLYIWGVIRYTNANLKPFRDIPFCRYTLATNVSHIKSLGTIDTFPKGQPVEDYRYADDGQNFRDCGHPI